MALFALGRVHLAAARAQTAADLGAVSAARELRGAARARWRLGAARGPAWRARLAAAAEAAAGPAGARVEGLELPGGAWPPTAVEVTVSVPGPRGSRVRAVARAGLVVSAAAAGGGATGWATGGGYSGPLVYRDGKPICPAVGAAFDLMDAAANAEGVDLVVVSGFRSDAEQAALFARHPDPRWVAPPGRSRHRDATELDLNMHNGGGGAHAWLSRNGARLRVRAALLVGALALGLPARLRRRDGGRAAGAAPPVPGGLPEWVPAALPRDRSPPRRRRTGSRPSCWRRCCGRSRASTPAPSARPGPRGSPSSCRRRRAGWGCATRSTPAEAIPAAARLLGGHLRAFGSVPLALAAYNAGPGAVRRYGGVPPYRETQAYVARIMALAGGAGALAGGAGRRRPAPGRRPPRLTGVCWHIMKRTTVKLPDELDARLRREAARRGMTISELTREAIDVHLGGGPRRRELRITGRRQQRPLRHLTARRRAPGRAGATGRTTDRRHERAHRARGRGRRFPLPGASRSSTSSPGPLVVPALVVGEAAFLIGQDVSGRATRRCCTRTSR